MHYDKRSDDVYRSHSITQTPTVHVYGAAGDLLSSEVYKVSDVPKLARQLAELVA